MKKSVRSLLILLGIITAILVIVIIIIAPKIIKEPYRTWRDDTLTKTFTESPYYGLSVFLKKLYPQTELRILPTFSEFGQADGTDNAVIFVADANNADEATQKMLLDWVAAGNHLVLSADVYGDEKLFPQLNLTLERNEPSAEDKAEAERMHGKQHLRWPLFDIRDKRLAKNIPPAIQTRCQQVWAAIEQNYSDMLLKNSSEERTEFLQECRLGLAALALPQAPERPLYLFSTAYRQDFVFHPEHAAVPVLMQAQSVYGTTLVRIPYGDGTITLSNNGDIFAHPGNPSRLNADITRFDNAYLAAYLAQGKSRIFILNSLENRPSPNLLPFWAQLVKKEPLLSVVSFLLLVSIIWHQAKRLGGKRRYDARAERQLIAHFAAQGQFVWRMGEQRAVLDQFQQELWQEWQRKLAGYTFSNQSQKINLLHRITSVSKADIALWLQPIPATVRRRDLLRYLRAHQRIRNQA